MELLRKTIDNNEDGCRRGPWEGVRYRRGGGGGWEGETSETQKRKMSKPKLSKGRLGEWRQKPCQDFHELIFN